MLLMTVFMLLLAAAALWGLGTIWFQGPGNAVLRLLWMAAWLLWLAGCGLWGLGRGLPAVSTALWVVSLLLMLTWWRQIVPSGRRDWADDVALHMQLQADGALTDSRQRVLLKNVRNFRWRSDEDYDVRWESRRYELAQLASVDVATSYWMGPAIAHTLVSFGFNNGEHVVFSIEIRKQKGEQFDALAGFFRRYELALIAADERDILAVRTNVRGEQLRLYRLNMRQSVMRELFMAYAREADSLNDKPRFYNTLTANCTTIVWQLARRVGATLPLDWRLLASGYLPEYLNSLGVLTPGYSLDELRLAGDITERAKAWQPAALDCDVAASVDFSRAIRAGMPGVLNTP